MADLTDSPLLRRKIRTGPAGRLGEPTQELAVAAMEAGRMDEARELARYMIPEGKALHDLMCDWVWDLLTRVAEDQGEEAVYRYLRRSQGGWMLGRTWKAFLKMPVDLRVQITAEIMRAHRCGPNQDGGITVSEDEERWVIAMDPCGSGGRMRRGDPVDGTPSRLGPPYDFGATRRAYPWSWGLSGVPYYCLHCAVNEILPIEWGGHPLWVTGYDPDARKPCRWYFYKRPELVPEKYFTRLGFAKPA